MGHGMSSYGLKKATEGRKTEHSSIEVKDGSPHMSCNPTRARACVWLVACVCLCVLGGGVRGELETVEGGGERENLKCFKVSRKRTGEMKVWLFLPLSF
jgi:hypothetical protein